MNPLPEKSQPNIYDIAKEAGVSIATVSRVLSGGSKVKDSTRRRVEEIIAESGYRPNAFARGLGIGTIKMAGLLCSDLSDTFSGIAVSILENLLRQNGLDTLLCCTGQDISGGNRPTDRLLGKNVDAIILVGLFSMGDDWISHIKKAAESVPVIIINGLLEHPNVYCVLCDEKKAVRENVRLLYEANFRNILYLYNLNSALSYSGVQKLNGYREGISAAGLDEDDALIVGCAGGPEDIKQRLIALVGSGLYFDSVIASDDLPAVGACKALARMGRRLPVIGFNNSVLAGCSTPEISSVDNRVEDMCEIAVQILCGLLGKSVDIPRKSVIDARLIRRETF